MISLKPEDLVETQLLKIGFQKGDSYKLLQQHSEWKLYFPGYLLLDKLPGKRDWISNPKKSAPLHCADDLPLLVGQGGHG